MEASFGFILLIVGIVGIARGSIDAPQENLGQVIGAGPGVASFVTLAAAFLLVAGLLILARTGRFSFEGSRSHPTLQGDSPAPPNTAVGHAADEKSSGTGRAALHCGGIPPSAHFIDAILQRSQADPQ